MHAWNWIFKMYLFLLLCFSDRFCACVCVCVHANQRHGLRSYTFGRCCDPLSVLSESPCAFCSSWLGRCFLWVFIWTASRDTLVKALLHCRHWAVLAFSFPCLALRPNDLAALVSESLLLLVCSLASSDASLGSYSGAMGPDLAEMPMLAEPVLCSVCSEASDRSSMNSRDV